MSQELSAITFKPKRQWKPKRRDRDPAKRRKRKQWYRKNKAKIRQKSRKRYKQLRNNPTYKRWQQKKRQEKTKRKFRQASEVFEPTPALGIPDIWVVFSDSPDTIDVDLGFVCDYDADEEEFLVFDVDDQDTKIIALDDFLTHVAFVEQEDLDNFLSLMDMTYEDLEEQNMSQDPLVQRVASAYLDKQAFNKENPAELLNHLVKVLDKASKQAEGKGKKSLMDALSRVKGLTKTVQDAWDTRNEE